MYDWSRSPAQNARPPDRFQLLLKGCTIEALFTTAYVLRYLKFQLLLKGCTIEAPLGVSNPRLRDSFQLLLKGCTIEAFYEVHWWQNSTAFQLLLKGCTIEACNRENDQTQNAVLFQLLLKGCTIEASKSKNSMKNGRGFSCCWKDVRLKPPKRPQRRCWFNVSVVVERMYDWSAHDSKETKLRVVSVVVERMYDWSTNRELKNRCYRRFSCCWKDVRLKLPSPRLPLAGVGCFSCCWKDVRLKLRNQLIENKWFLTVGFWSVFRKWSICTKSAIIFENLGWFGWLLDCFW